MCEIHFFSFEDNMFRRKELLIIQYDKLASTCHNLINSNFIKQNSPCCERFDYTLLATFKILILCFKLLLMFLFIFYPFLCAYLATSHIMSYCLLTNNKNLSKTNNYFLRLVEIYYSSWGHDSRFPSI